MGLHCVAVFKFRCSDTKAQDFLSNSTSESPALEYLPLKESGFLLLLAVGIVYCIKDMSPNQRCFIFLFSLQVRACEGLRTW